MSVFRTEGYFPGEILIEVLKCSLNFKTTISDVEMLKQLKSGNVVILFINPQRTIVRFADISIVPTICSFNINSRLSCFSDLNLMLLNY